MTIVMQMQLTEEIEPVLILDKDGKGRLQSSYELLCIARRICRQVHDGICSSIILSDFIAGRREESEEDIGSGVQVVQCLYDRSALFKFPQGGTVNPDQLAVSCFFAHGLQVGFPRLSPCNPGFCLRVP